MTAPHEPRDYCPRCGVAYEPLAGVLPRVRRAPADESRRRRRSRVVVAAPFRLVSGRLDLAGRRSSSCSRSSRRRSSLIANSTRASSAGARDGDRECPRRPRPDAGHRSGGRRPRPSRTRPRSPSRPGHCRRAPGVTRDQTRCHDSDAEAESEDTRLLAGAEERLHDRPRIAARRPAARRTHSRGRGAAKQNGLKDVGVLTSSQYSSLHPGYYVVFAGIFGSAAEAAAGLSSAHARGFPDAYQTRVTH